MLNLVIVHDSTIVNVIEPARLVTDNIAGYTVHKDELDSGKDSLWVSPGELVDSSKLLGTILVRLAFFLLMHVNRGNLGSWLRALVIILFINRNLDRLALLSFCANKV